MKAEVVEQTAAFYPAFVKSSLKAHLRGSIASISGGNCYSKHDEALC